MNSLHCPSVYMGRASDGVIYMVTCAGMPNHTGMHYNHTNTDWYEDVSMDIYAERSWTTFQATLRMLNLGYEQCRQCYEVVPMEYVVQHNRHKHYVIEPPRPKARSHASLTLFGTDGPVRG